MMARRQAATDEQAAVIGYAELAGKATSTVAKLVTGFDPESVVRAGWDFAIEMIDEAEELLNQAKKMAKAGRELCHPELDFVQPAEGNTGSTEGEQVSEEKHGKGRKRAANG